MVAPVVSMLAIDRMRCHFKYHHRLIRRLAKKLVRVLKKERYSLRRDTHRTCRPDKSKLLKSADSKLFHGAKRLQAVKVTLSTPTILSRPGELLRTHTLSRHKKRSHAQTAKLPTEATPSPSQLLLATSLSGIQSKILRLLKKNAGKNPNK